jgi:hypothetical protein
MQTAVEWLINELVELDKLLDGRRKNEDATVFKLSPDKLFEQAKEMEKEQICNSYVDGLEGPYIGSEEYYNKTFNQEPKKEYGPSEKYLEKQKELMEDFIWNKMNKNKQNK